MNTEQQRASFEAWYVEHFKEHTGRKDFTLEVMRSMRGKHNDYREHAYLHGLWLGYQAAFDSQEVQALRDISNEYNELIRYAHTGGDALEFLSRRAATGAAK